MALAPDLCGRALNDRYELHALIGEGAFGRVYRGRDRRLGRSVAVKVIKPWWSEDPEWVRSFEREAQLLARVNDPGIVQIFDVGTSPEGLYYVAELVEGESLASRLRRGVLAPWEACEIAEQLCLALAHAHAHRVVHRDVKPANVLISTRGRVKVGDFGVALLAEGSSDGAAATIVGTPRYMAPEQAQGRPATPATDVYSVGVVVYEMLAGCPPFTGTSPVELALSHLRDRPAPLPPGTPAALAWVVERALAKDPASRYDDGAAMGRALALARAARRESPALPRGATAATAAPASADRPPTGPGGGGATERQPGAGRRHAAVRQGARVVAPTRVAPRLTPRRNVNPAARRRAGALLAAVLMLLAGMVAVAIAAGRRPQVRVPTLTGLPEAAVSAKASALGLHLALRTSFDAKHRPNIAIDQVPGPGVQVSRGSTVQVVLSAGPPPVPVPQLTSETSSDARTTLGSLGLRTSVEQVPAPGQSPGTVTGQAPLPGSTLLPGSTVLLRVAEQPRWQALSSFGGESAARTGTFRIRGGQWRLIYNMAYQGTCTWVVFCSGPSASVIDRGAGWSAAGFDLSDGRDQTQVFRSGPGVYRVTVTPGNDDARWSMTVEDYY